MRTHLLNLFVLKDLVRLQHTYRLFKVTNLPQNDQFNENLQRLVGMISKDTRKPACLYKTDDSIYVATTAAADQVKNQWRLVPYIACLVREPRDYSLDYSNITASNAEVALNLLRYEIRTALGKNRELWNDTPGSFYSRTSAYSDTVNNIEMLEGFVFRLHWLLDNNIY